MGSRKVRVAVVTALVAALAPALVHAASAEKPVVRYNAADQALAKAAVLKKADLGAGWKGGAKKPEIGDPSEDCPEWNPRQADLTVTGAAESEFEFRAGALTVTSTAYVLETAEMVKLDWQRTVVAPAVVRCLRKVFTEASDEEARFVSAKRTPFPRVGALASRLRAVVNYVQGETKVPVLVDFVALGKGRTEVALVVAAALRDRRAAEAFELRVARLLVSRIAA